MPWTALNGDLYWCASCQRAWNVARRWRGVMRCFRCDEPVQLMRH